MLIALVLATKALLAADADECRQLLQTGEYARCRVMAANAVASKAYGEDWPLLKAEAELAQGRYADALATVQAGLKRYSTSVQLRLAGHTAAQHAGQLKLAADWLKEIDELATRAPWRYTDADDLVTLGKAALLVGADAKDVLNGFFSRARLDDPDDRAAYLASGFLALEKHDSDLAMKFFDQAIKRFPHDADLQFGISRATASSNPKRSEAALGQTLKLNPHHAEALLSRVEQHIDKEDFTAAEQLIQQILTTNPREPRAWAYRAVLSHLANDPKSEAAFRASAQGLWGRNPRVDHLIGKKLSQKYRFREGAAYQRRALAFDPNHLASQMQLSQDLLRLGEEDRGWEFAKSVHEKDGYNVAAYNLLELRDAIAQFKTLKADDFIIRMDAHEADIYGDRVLALLTRAKSTLCKKYGLELKHPVTVEIFPDANDFAVRTFGMPGVSGYLGVCFGRVITANSPASQAENPSNWESVLWHEFCHVVTLELTQNKMPRWLSEGISVYEELQENKTWGQRMTPRYREVILGGELTPVGKLSSAFLSPKSSFHVQFAYYESALVVEYLINHYGLESLKNILRDLGAGLPINVALDRRTDGLKQLEDDFDEFAKRRAKNLAAGVDWTKPDLAALLNNDDEQALPNWLKDHPKNFIGLTARAEQLIEAKRWKDAVGVLQKLIALYPAYTGGDNAYEMLAAVYRELGDKKSETKTLTAFVARDASAATANLRLLELLDPQKQAANVMQATDRLLAVNPLLPQLHRARSIAAEEVKDIPAAVASYRALLRLKPDDPARVHFRLASLLQEQKKLKEAKRHVLQALEEAPRYRAAHKLLLKLKRE